MYRTLGQSIATVVMVVVLGGCPAAIDIPDALGLCDPEATLGDVPAAPTYIGQVRDLLDAHCSGCHSSDGPPPVLTTFASAAAASDLIVSSVLTGSMPPLTPRGCCQDYLTDRALTPEEVLTLQRWHDAGAPEGDAGTTGAVGNSDGWLLASSGWAPQWVAITEQYTPAPSVGRDDVRCFLLEVPRTADAVITGFRVLHSSAQAARSAMYRVDEDELEEFRALASADADAGWNCYAGLTQRASALLGASRADSVERRLPGDVGRSLPATSQVVLLVQYATDGLAPDAIEPDQPRVELRLSDRTDRVAQTLVVANPYWVLSGGMTIGAGESDVHHQFSFDATDFVTNGKAFDVVGVSLQMHDRGTRAQLVVERTDGSVECLLAYDPWHTRAYTEHLLNTPVRVEPGERLAISCHWDHSGGSTNLGWNADEEVCLGTVMYTVVSE